MAAPMEAPILFDDDLLEDMQLALLAMEKRVKEGRGSLSLLEVEELDARLNRIKNDMRANQHKKLERPVQESGQEPVEPTAPPATPVQPAQKANVAPGQVVVQPRTSDVMDTSQDEGPAYDGHGGMGQPKGTVNTYIIEGMDEMDSDEYRLALQQSLIDRQARRRSSGAAGNRSSLDYLNSISGGTGMLRNDAKSDSLPNGGRM